MTTREIPLDSNGQRLPPRVARAARGLNLPPHGVQAWAVRPNGTIVLVTLNGAKFVIPRVPRG